MQETVSWKGHSFTLFVFAGIVVLCSIFFVLGMLVGRTQGQRSADAAQTGPHLKPAAPVQERTEINSEKPKPLTETEKAAPPDTVGAVSDRATPQREEGPPSPAPGAPAADVISLQLGAFERASAAEKLIDEVRGRGFTAFVLRPAPGDANPLFKVQVGPFESEAEAEIARRKLESLGYMPQIKK